MRIKSLVLLFAFGIWGALLQLTAKPAISSMSLWRGVATYTLPPLIFWITWVIALWRASARLQKQNELHAAEETARREGERVAARQRHDDELKQRRFHCDCRVVAITAANVDNSLLMAELPANAEINALGRDNALPRDSTVLERLRPIIMNTLGAVYSASSAAPLLPIYVAPPDDVPGNEVLQLIRAIRSELLQSMEPLETAYRSPPVLFLPAIDSAPNSVLSLFENTPDLPGATILAFDSALSRFASEDGDLAETMRYPHHYANGAPNEGAVALLVTHADLPRMIESLSDMEPTVFEHDAMTPFWERKQMPDGHLSLVANMSSVQRADLAALHVLAHIHRATFVEAKTERTGTLEMTQVFQGLLENAQINAWLIDKPFTLESASAEDAGETALQQRCGRLIHNAGHAHNGGRRLAALGSAMLYFDIDLSPVDRDTATNTVTCIGDLGCASSTAQLALSIVHAATSTTPALSVEFTGGGAVAASIARPARLPA